MNIRPLNPSMTTLPKLLEERNKDGRYDQLIDRAKKGYYHDYKFNLLPNTDYIDPKVQLLNELANFPELLDIYKQVMSGDFDDRMDEADKAQMRKDLDQDGMGHFKPLLGL